MQKLVEYLDKIRDHIGYYCGKLTDEQLEERGLEKLPSGFKTAAKKVDDILQQRAYLYERWCIFQ